MDMKTKEFRSVFAVAVFCAFSFYVLLNPLCDSFAEFVIVFSGSFFFMTIPFWIPKDFLESDIE